VKYCLNERFIKTDWLKGHSLMRESPKGSAHYMSSKGEGNPGEEMPLKRGNITEENQKGGRKSSTGGVGTRHPFTLLFAPNLSL